MLKVHARKFGSVIVLCLRGRIVRGELATLRAAVNSQTGASAVVLDLTGVTTIDAGGLGAMLELREQTQAKNIEFKLMNPSNFVGWVLGVTRLNSVFEIMSGSELHFASHERTQPIALAACARADSKDIRHEVREDHLPNRPVSSASCLISSGSP